MPAGRRPPPRRLPLVYFGLAYAALLLALAAVALEPGKASGFFLTPYTVFAVHLVTLGWIVHSIIGAFYLAAPLALRMEFPAGRGDAWVCAFVAIGASGVAAHFWIEEYSGIAYAGVMLLLCFEWLLRRVRRALKESPIERGTKAIITIAWSNLTGTAFLGLLLAINKTYPILPGTHYQSVFGHAHLGLVGFASLMLIGVGLRMLPIALPARPPDERHAFRILIPIQVGVIGAVLAWLFAPSLARWASIPIAFGLLYFLGVVIGMLRNRLPAPPARRRPDIGMLHAMQALLYLAVAIGIGLSLVFTETLLTDRMLAYGVIVLLGFLGQAILGVSMRLLPMYGWLRDGADGDHEEMPASPSTGPVRALQITCFVLWTAGVPALAWGMSQHVEAWVQAGAWSLFAAVVAAGLASLRAPTT
ncbi:MAG: hypothetical protein AAGD14_00325 [Planctomycetota bacterium]